MKDPCDSAPRDGYVVRLCLCGATFCRHKRSRQQLCCACKRTNVVSTFGPAPAQTVFKTMAEVDAYLGGETIRCTICGGDFEMLGTHLRSHRVTQRDYKTSMGIPLTRKLSVEKIRKRAQSRAIKRIANGEMRTSADPEHAKLIARVPRAIVRPTAPAAIASMRHGLKTNPSLTPVPSACSQCGADAGMRREHAVLKHACRILCRDCKKQRHIESEQRWLAKLGFSSKSEYMRALYLRKKVQCA